MITFDNNGLLTPDRAISCTLDELRIHFVDNIPSKTRLGIFNNYVEYSNNLKKLLGVKELKQWINGSFVTSIQNPKDIDFVTFIDSDIANTHRVDLEKFISNNSLLNIGIDPYIIEVYKKDDPLHVRYESDKAYWTNKFDKTRRDRTGIKNPKGFLEHIY